MWTYNGDPASSATNEVRFLVGDTDAKNKLVQDEEIAYAIGIESSIMRAAVRVARGIATRFARNVEKQVGDLKIKAGDKYKNYLEVVKVLEAEAASSMPGASPFAGGISVAAKTTQENDTDRSKPAFKRGMMDNPNSTTAENIRDLD